VATFVTDGKASRHTTLGRPTEREPERGALLQPYLYRARNLVERFFNKIKQYSACFDKAMAARQWGPRSNLCLRPHMTVRI
jgi:hypothetical protein